MSRYGTKIQKGDWGRPSFPQILPERKSAKFGLYFQPQSPFEYRRFKMEQHICNLKQLAESPMIIYGTVWYA